MSFATPGAKQVFKLTFDNQDPAADFDSEMAAITQDLKDQGLQTAAMGDTLFDAQDKMIKTKSTVLVTAQDANLGAPDLDYTADIRATFQQLDNDTWKFRDLTVYADNAPPVVKKR